MTTPMPGQFSRALLNGLAELLAARGIGVWSPVGAYTPHQLALTIGGLPATPDTAISLAIYGTGGDDLDNGDSTVLVQLRMRAKGDPRDVGDYADAVFAVLHGLTEVRLPSGVLVLLARRTVVAPPGRDSSGRWERADSYELIVHWPTPQRDDD
ncbi:minor capsid protein [Nonomuraea angiospora]|uniref:minor capsid protein n=2 Tax=Nonomuraea angiospora TaxID=46172 RepID=UPI0036A03B74